MDLLRSFFKRITDDLKQKKLIPLKVLFFVQASTVLVLYPYLTIHMRELGINVEETAIMSAVTPVVSIVMPPLAGMLADKIGNFKLLLAVASLLGGSSALLLLLVPVGRITVTFPTAVELLATCETPGLRLQNLQDYPCLPVHPYAHEINMTLLSCGFVCDTPIDFTAEDMDDITQASAYDVQLHSLVDSQMMLYRHSVTSQVPQSNVPLKDESTSHVVKNNPFFNISISKVSDDRIFFPTPQLYNLECSLHPNATCIFGNNDIFSEQALLTKQTVYRARISHDAQTVPTHVKDYWVKAIAIGNITKFNEDNDDMDMVSCQDKFDTMNEKQRVRVVAGSQRLAKCSAACAVSVPRRDICDNKKQLIDIDPVFTFWTYLAVRVFVGIIGSTTFAMFEGAVIAILREHKADYGMQRLYGSLGGMISSPLSGMLIDYASRGKGYTDFRPAFYLYAILKILSAALMLSIDLEFKQPAKNLMTDVVHVFKNFEIVALFLAAFVLGTAWGYIESFLFWLLQDLGGSRSLMGITVTVGGIAGVPLLVLSGPIIKKLGHANVLFIGFVFYAIRLFGYSLIYNPWLCLIFEAMESVTSSLTFTAAVTYAASLSSITTDTSVQGLLGGIYYGVGKGAGSLIGGYLMKFFGTRPTYQILASSMLIFGCIYYLLNMLYMRQRRGKNANDIDKQCNDIETQDPKKDIEIIKADLPNLGDKNGAELPRAKVVGDNNTDGGSDSGVENPAFDAEAATKP